MSVKAAAIGIVIAAVLALCLNVLINNDQAAAEYRAKQPKAPVVLGHRINSLGQEVLVVKTEVGNG